MHGAGNCGLVTVVFMNMLQCMPKFTNCPFKIWREYNITVIITYNTTHMCVKAHEVVVGVNCCVDPGEAIGWEAKVKL